MLPAYVQELVDELASFPGIGPRSAARIALHLLSKGDKHRLEQISQRFSHTAAELQFCARCFNFSDQELCTVCRNPERDQSKLLVIETALDLVAFEEAGYRGLYHVLGGVISPLQGKGVDSIRLKELVARVGELLQTNSSLEVILACPTSLEGEATSSLITEKLTQDYKDSKLKVTKLGRGLPANSHIDYQDSNTLNSSLQNRVDILA
jgi:recombination protein RecR